MKALLFSWLQFVLPKHLLTALVFRLARIRRPAIKDRLIRAFVDSFDVDLDDVARDVPGDFEDFNDFFTRELKDDARPIDGSAFLVSPVDGRLSQRGSIDDGTLVQAKGLDYGVADLLAVDIDTADQYAFFATIYLAPHDYHRVHMPADGELVAAHYVPGALFSVNELTAVRVRDLFARNARLNLHFETDAGPLFLSMVGAVNVGSISTPWTGTIRPRSSGPVVPLDLDGHERVLRRGDLLGWFNMGSTVILMTPATDWLPTAGAKLRMGEAIGRQSS